MPGRDVDATVGGTHDDLELAARLRLAIARLSRQLRRQAGTGLTPSQQSALAYIGAYGPLSLGELAAGEQVSPPTVTRVVDKLEKQGLVIRQPDPNDRRVVRVTITDDGEDRMEQSRSRRNAWLAQRLQAMDPADVDALRAALETLERLAQPDQP